MASTLAEDREVVDRIQRGAERRDQLAASVKAAETALQTSSESLAALEKEVGEVGAELAEKSKRSEELRVEKVKTETRLMMIRKSLVRTSFGSDA